MDDIAEYLLSKRANVDHQDEQGWTALHIAAQNNHLAVVKLLLEQGPQADAKEAYGNTPLWKAVFAYKGDPTIIKLLVAAGADRFAKNNNNVSPHDFANTMGVEIDWT